MVQRLQDAVDVLEVRHGQTSAHHQQHEGHNGLGAARQLVLLGKRLDHRGGKLPGTGAGHHGEQN